MVWYSHLLKNFLQFAIHTVKAFSIVNEAEVDVSLEFPCFFYDPVYVGNLISDSSTFTKSVCTSGISQHLLKCESYSQEIVESLKNIPGNSSFYMRI